MTDPKNANRQLMLTKGARTEPHIHPSTGQHDPDIQDESTNKRNNKKPQQMILMEDILKMIRGNIMMESR